MTSSSRSLTFCGYDEVGGGAVHSAAAVLALAHVQAGVAGLHVLDSQAAVTHARPVGHDAVGTEPLQLVFDLRAEDRPECETRVMEAGGGRREERREAAEVIRILVCWGSNKSAAAKRAPKERERVRRVESGVVKQADCVCCTHHRVVLNFAHELDVASDLYVLHRRHPDGHV